MKSGPNTYDDYTSLATSGSPAVRAQATDEDSNVWVGFSLPARPDYLSWALSSAVTLSNENLSGVPDFSTQPDNDYGSSLTILHSPLERHSPTEVFDGTPFGDHQKGFGWEDAQYNTYPDDSHSGFDFFGGDELDVLAVTGGIVVGVGKHNSVAPGMWGAADQNTGDINLIIRTGGYFLVYGHLNQIDPSLYIGARVGPGAVLGKPRFDNDNTHIHLEVRMFTEDQMAANLPTEARPVRCRFGEIVRNADNGEINYHPKPKLVVDPMKFIKVHGTSTYSATTERRTYMGAKLLLDDELVTFNYEVRDTLDQKSFDLSEDTLIVINPVPAPVGPEYCS